MKLNGSWDCESKFRYNMEISQADVGILLLLGQRSRRESWPQGWLEYVQCPQACMGIWGPSLGHMAHLMKVFYPSEMTLWGFPWLVPSLLVLYPVTSSQDAGIGLGRPWNGDFNSSTVWLKKEHLFVPLVRPEGTQLVPHGVSFSSFWLSRVEWESQHVRVSDLVFACSMSRKDCKGV